ncbi:uncharacterized protein [Nicotiana sylvestris]|uniref:uncharacterized protein n=1 Tax=Nicotiana sylvestris TaxID=4096 RepID=UPI00388C40FC
MDSRPDSIQEPEENENIKTIIEELEVVLLSIQLPERKVYVGANLSYDMKGYNQIKMDPIDEEKTSFITDRGTYYYKVIPFGLKNVGATYQSLVTKIFQEHLGKTMEVYIDDMLVKTQHSGDHISHLSDTFQILRKFNMKLNPEKCAFGVASDKFLGFLVSNRGIEVNLTQIKAIEAIPNMLTSKKEEQRLTGRIAALTYLSNPPLLAKPKVGEKLLIYLAVSEVAVSDVLVREDQDAEMRYPQLEKLALALIMASRKLRPYFQCHPIAVVTTYPLHNILHKHELSGLGIVLVPPTGETIRQAIKCHFITNNEAEYEAVITGLRLARELDVNQIVIKSDSQLEVNQMLGTYTAREARMQQYLEKYGIVPEDKKKAHALRKKAARYCLKQGNLYRKMFGGSLARCLGPSQTEYVMREIHEGHCENHAGGRSLGETPFSLVYGAEALIPIEIGEPSTRFTQASEEYNDEEMRINLDLLEGKKETALIRMVAQKQVMERYYNRKARLKYFKIGDFILKKVFQSTKAANAGKLSPTWEGPYKIHGMAGKGAYELETIDDKILPSH